jgi:hypothetical protein
MQIASQDREMILREAAQKEAQEMLAMRELFQAADTDGDGDLTVAELTELVSHPEVRSWLATIDLDIVDDFDAVIHVLDPEGKGFVKADEFYATIGRFKGPARRLETTLLLMETRHAHKSFHKFHKKHNASLDRALSQLEHDVIEPLRRPSSQPLFSSKSYLSEGDRQKIMPAYSLKTKSDADLMRSTALKNSQSQLHGALESMYDKVSELERIDAQKSTNDGGRNKFEDDWHVHDCQEKSIIDVEHAKIANYGFEASLKKLDELANLDSNHVKKLSATRSRLRKMNNRTAQQSSNPMQQEQWEKENKKISPDRLEKAQTAVDPSKVLPELLSIPRGIRAWPISEPASREWSRSNGEPASREWSLKQQGMPNYRPISEPASREWSRSNGEPASREWSRDPQAETWRWEV